MQRSPADPAHGPVSLVRRVGFEPTFSWLRTRAPRPLEDRRVGAVHRSRTDTLWMEARHAAVEHQHRFVWGGAGNRTLALTFTASRAATDTSATVLLVWVLGFEPRTSSVRGRHSGQAELHPVTAIWSSVPDSNRDHSLIGRRSCQLDEPTVISRFLSASRLSFHLPCPAGEAGIRPL